MNSLIIQNPYEFFQFFSTLLIFFLTLKNERNVANFGYVFVKKFHITSKNFPEDWSNGYTVLVSICFQNLNLLKRKKKKNWKNSYGFWKINKFIWNRKKYRLTDYLLNNFFYQCVNNFSALLLCKIFFWHGWFFQINLNIQSNFIVDWTIFFTNLLIIFWHYYYVNKCFWHPWYAWFSVNFCYIAKYWNSD